MGTSFIPHLRHVPGLSSMTSSSPAIVHTYESGGSFWSAALEVLATCPIVDASNASHAAASPSRKPLRLISSSLCYTFGRVKTRILAPLTLPALALATVWSTAGTAQSSRADAAFDRFWAAASPDEAAARVDEVVASGVSYDDTLRRLRAGRSYSAQSAGLVPLSNKMPDGVEHHYAVTVPDGYDPSKRYPVRIQLHGGVMNRRTAVPPPNAGGIGALASDEPEIYQAPFAWDA